MSNPTQSAPAVSVFAPAPLLTITLEAGAEAPEFHLHAGGQGFWIARMAAVLGAEVTLCGSFGGETGLVVRHLIADSGLEVRATAVGGANGAYLHDRRGGERVVVAEMPAAPLSRHEVDELYGSALVAGLEAGVSVLGGPAVPGLLPADAYRRLASDLTANSTTVVADLSGAELAEAAAGGLAMIKVSDEELRADHRLEGDRRDAIVDVIVELANESGADVVVSRAAQPVLAQLDGDLWLASTPRLEPVDERGAGDALTAGLAVGLARGLARPDALALGVAAGTLNVTRRGLASGSREEIERLTDHVEVQRLPYPATRRSR